jgi:hypothetical protein
MKSIGINKNIYFPEGAILRGATGAENFRLTGSIVRFQGGAGGIITNINQLIIQASITYGKAVVAGAHMNKVVISNGGAWDGLGNMPVEFTGSGSMNGNNYSGAITLNTTNIAKIYSSAVGLTIGSDIASTSGISPFLEINAYRMSGVTTHSLTGNVDLVKYGNATIKVTATDTGGPFTNGIAGGLKVNLATGAGKSLPLATAGRTLTITHDIWANVPGMTTNACNTTLGIVAGGGAAASSDILLTGKVGGTNGSSTRYEIPLTLGAATSNYYGTITLAPDTISYGTNDTLVLTMTNGSYLGYASVAGIGIVRCTNSALQLCGSISPGTNSTGTLNVQGDLAFNAGSKMVWGTNAMLQVSGGMSASGAWTLELVNAASLPRGQNVLVVAHASTIDPNVVSRGSIASLVWRLATQDAAGGGKDLIIVNQPVGTVVQIK